MVPVKQKREQHEFVVAAFFGFAKIVVEQAQTMKRGQAPPGLSRPDRIKHLCDGILPIGFPGMKQQGSQGKFRFRALAFELEQGAEQMQTAVVVHRRGAVVEQRPEGPDLVFLDFGGANC